MTTAARPTFHPAIGSAHGGGWRLYPPNSANFHGHLSKRFVQHERALKTRSVLGMSDPSLSLPIRSEQRIELEKREENHKNKQQHHYGFDTQKQNTKNVLEQFDDADDENIIQRAKETLEQSENSDENSEEEEEKELQREIMKIREEKEQEKKKIQQLEEAERMARNEEMEVLNANPLLKYHEMENKLPVKRRWDDDVVFKNQTAGVPIDARAQKKLNNDSVRNDFHRNFLKRFVHG